MNTVMLSGVVASEPQFSKLEIGISKIFFAIKETHAGREAVIPCVAWRGVADSINKMYKMGDPISVTGTLENFLRNVGENGVDKKIKEVRMLIKDYDKREKFVPMKSDMPSSIPSDMPSGPAAFGASELPSDFPEEDDFPFPF